MPTEAMPISLRSSEFSNSSVLPLISFSSKMPNRSTLGNSCSRPTLSSHFCTWRFSHCVIVNFFLLVVGLRSLTVCAFLRIFVLVFLGFFVFFLVVGDEGRFLVS